MSKLAPIFANFESRLAPELANPGAAVRDRILYSSAGQDAAEHPQRFPDSSMEVTRPGELDVTTADATRSQSTQRHTEPRGATVRSKALELDGSDALELDKPESQDARLRVDDGEDSDERGLVDAAMDLAKLSL